MPQWVVDVLLEERESVADPDGWVFPSKRTRSGHIEQMSTAFTRFAAVTHGDPATMKRYSGHLSLQALMRYIHPSDEHVDSVLDRIGAAHQVSDVVSLAARR